VPLLRVQTWTRRALRVGASVEDVRAVLERFNVGLSDELMVEARE
jgi:hypothetical protein